MGEFDVKDLGLVGAALVIANQALRILGTIIKERVDEKRSPGAQARSDAGCLFGPHPVECIERIDRNVNTMMHGVVAGSYRCKWQDEAQVSDHIRDAKETLKKVEEKQ